MFPQPCLCNSMTLHDCFSVIGTAIFFVPSTLSSKVVLKSRYSNSFMSKKVFLHSLWSQLILIYLEPCLLFFTWSSKKSLLVIRISSIYVLTYSRPSNDSFICSWIYNRLLYSLIGSFWYSYFPQGNAIVHSFLEKEHDLIW